MRYSSRLALSLILVIGAACSEDEPGSDAGVLADAGFVDSGAADTGVEADAGPEDSGEVDSGAPDSGEVDAGEVDSGAPDSGAPDAGVDDAGEVDAAASDSGELDAGPDDAGEVDGGPADTGVVVDAGPADTGVAVDAGPADTGVTDAGPAVCDVEVSLPETNAGQVGASGGSPGPNLECPAGAEMVGVAARISDANTSNGGRSAVGLTAVCAALTIDPQLGVTLGPETLPEVAGTGQFGWTPATQSTITRCPDGWLLSGLSASRGTTGNRFLEVNMTCTELLPDGTTTGVPRDFYVMGTLQEAGTRDVVACPAGQVVRRIATRIGAGFDAASLLCGAPTCGP